MATTAKINCKNMDYFKFKKIIVDGNRDDYESCSREIRAMCDSAQTLNFRDEQFADDDVIRAPAELPSQSDRRHFEEILTGYRQILAGKRIDPIDIRVKTGWWADTTPSGAACGSAGKFKSSALRDTLLAKSSDWRARHGQPPHSSADDLDRPGVYVFKHRERQCFQFVGRSERGVFAACSDLLKAAFDGSTSAEPLVALLVVSMAADWDFYFLSVNQDDGERMLRIVENDTVLKHDSIWPRGLNRMLNISSPLEVAELRLSCLRHRWPPSDTELPPDEREFDLSRLRKRLHACRSEPQATVTADAGVAPPSKNATPKTLQQHSPTSHSKSGLGSPSNGDAAVPTARSSTQKRTIPPKSSPTKPPARPQLPTTPRTAEASNSAPAATMKSRPSSAPRPLPASHPPHPSSATSGPASSRPKSAAPAGSDDRRKSLTKQHQQPSHPVEAKPDGDKATKSPGRQLPKTKTSIPTRNGVKPAAQEAELVRETDKDVEVMITDNTPLPAVPSPEAPAEDTLSTSQVLGTVPAIA